jgi:hypothetical protein
MMSISKRLRTKLKITSATESTRIAQGSVDATFQAPSTAKPCGRSTSCAVETRSNNSVIKPQEGKLTTAEQEEEPVSEWDEV